MEYSNWLNRTEMLIGKNNTDKLQKSNIVVFGLGGVGSYVVEGLCRAGVGNIAIIDNVVIDITNINRQLIADITTIGMPKVDVEEERMLKINPDINICKIKDFVNKDNIHTIMDIIKSNFFTSSTSKDNFDYVVDAIDTVSSKLEIIKWCNENHMPILSCMGTGNKLDANRFEITDITNTSVCPLAKVIRKELKKLNIPHLKVLYSKEEPIKNSSSSPASISFVPSVAGLLIAGDVIKSIIEK